MVESYQPRRLPERKSEQLTPAHYLLEQYLPRWGTRIVGLAGGWLVGGAIGGAIGARRGQQAGNWIGSIAGASGLGFLNWRKTAAAQMDAAEVAIRMREVLPMAMTTDEVKAEIAHTNELLGYERRENGKLKTLIAEGPKSATGHAESDIAVAGR